MTTILLPFAGVPIFVETTSEGLTFTHRDRSLACRRLTLDDMRALVQAVAAAADDHDRARACFLTLQRTTDGDAWRRWIGALPPTHWYPFGVLGMAHLTARSMGAPWDYIVPRSPFALAPLPPAAQALYDAADAEVQATLTAVREVLHAALGALRPPPAPVREPLSPPDAEIAP